MQLTYQVNEADFRQACKLRMRSGLGGKTLKTVMFWVFVLVCLMLLWAVVTRSNEKRSEDSATPVTQSQQDSQAPVPAETSLPRTLLVNVGPFVLIAGVWAFILFRLMPWSVRRAYRKDPVSQGVFTIDVNPSGMDIQNTAGISSQVQWNVFEWWREKRNVIAVTYKSGAFFIISLAQASEPQREELRGILSGALPKK
jgi:hypothetical protein